MRQSRYSFQTLSLLRKKHTAHTPMRHIFGLTELIKWQKLSHIIWLKVVPIVIKQMCAMVKKMDSKRSFLLWQKNSHDQRKKNFALNLAIFATSTFASVEKYLSPFPY